MPPRLRLLLLGAGHFLKTETGVSLPAKIMESYRLGGQSATLILTEKGGRMLSLLSPQQPIPVWYVTQAQPEDSTRRSGQAGDSSGQEEALAGAETTSEQKPRNEELLTRADCLIILSRLGSEYVLSYRGQIITLPKKEVVSWSARRDRRSVDGQDECETPPRPAGGSMEDSRITGE